MTIAAADDPDQPGVDEPAFVVPTQSATTTRASGFERIYATHYRDVYRYVLSLTRSVEETEDICADTFERALRGWFEVPDRPIAWLLLTARRLATDRWRRARRLARLLVSNQSNRAGASPTFDAEFDAWFGSLASVLTERQREVSRPSVPARSDRPGHRVGDGTLGIRGPLPRLARTRRTTFPSGAALMNDRNDLDGATFARFAERFARIERQVPDPPAFAAGMAIGSRGRTRRSPLPGWATVIVMLVAVVGLAVIGSRLLQTTVTPPPTASPNATAQATPPGSPTPAPTLAATNPPPLGAAWEGARNLGDADIFSLARGPLGWVAAGTTGDGRDAGAWFSTDGLDWSGGAIPNDEAGSSWASSVTAHGSGWIAAGGRGHADLVGALLWRSEDGRTWSLADSILLGPCPAGCPTIGSVAAGSGGAILSWVQTIDPDRTGVYWSRDGNDWTQIDRAVFGQRPGVGTFAFSAATVLDDGRFVLVAHPCDGCGAVWTSIDGRDWSQDATLAPDPVWLDMATDGRRVVVVEACEGCFTEVWTSPDGRTGWQRGAAELPIVSAQVTYAGGQFVVAGQRFPNGVSMYTSPDGAEWTRIASDLPIGDCGVADLVGSEDRILLAAGEHCRPGIWVSRAP